MIMIIPIINYNNYFYLQYYFLLVGWLVVLGLTALWDSISVHIGPSPKRGRKRRERIDESKTVQTTPTRTYCKCSRPLSYYNPNCRTPRHWKFTQHHRTTRPPHFLLVIITIIVLIIVIVIIVNNNNYQIYHYHSLFLLLLVVVIIPSPICLSDIIILIFVGLIGGIFTLSACRVQRRSKSKQINVLGTLTEAKLGARYSDRNKDEVPLVNDTSEDEFDVPWF